MKLHDRSHRSPCQTVKIGLGAAPARLLSSGAAAERTAMSWPSTCATSAEVTELAERPAVRPKAVQVDVAAHLLSLSRTSLYDLLDAGRIRSVRVGTRRLIPSTALDNFLADPEDVDTEAS